MMAMMILRPTCGTRRIAQPRCFVFSLLIWHSLVCLLSSLIHSFTGRQAELARETYGETTFRVIGIQSAIKELVEEECQMQIVVNPGGFLGSGIYECTLLVSFDAPLSLSLWVREAVERTFFVHFLLRSSPVQLCSRRLR